MEKSALFHSPVSELGNAVVIVVSSVFLSNGYSAYWRSALCIRSLKYLEHMYSMTLWQGLMLTSKLA